MRDPLLRAFSDNDSSTKSDHEESWLSRVRENLGQLLIPAHLKPTAANGAPIHLLKVDKSLRPARAQGTSLITHGAAFAAALLLLAHGPGTTSPLPRGVTQHGPVDIPMPVFRSFTSEHPSNPGGHSGDQNQIPATHGELPPRSPVVLVRPTLPQDQHPSLPEPPTIFDTTAAPAASTGKIGLPWMQLDTNSAGPGKGHGIGSKDGNTMGDDGDGPAGDGTGTGPYSPGLISPMCVYCPSPTYTDDARHGKVQGSVTLQVLVGADGRAQNIRIVKGVGFGLDERAMESVRGWKFAPARDAAQRAVPAWVTVEAVFRLF
jgi:periplasmic protein TonB